MTEPGDRSDVELEELQDRVSWLVRLRWVAALGVVATVWMVPRVIGIRLWERPLYWTVGGLAAYNLVVWSVNRWVPAATRGISVSHFTNAQIALDLVFLTVLLHFSGGIENPFVCYYVFHVVIASILLSRAATYLQVSFAVTLLAAMTASEAVGLVPHYHLPGFLDPQAYRRPSYALGVAAATTTMLVFAAFMATSITSRLRRREAEVVGLSDALREHADELADAYAALRQLEHDKSDYLHRAAHHLRSPLATLERMLTVVVEGRTGGISTKTHEMLERARDRARGMGDLARDLLVLSRARRAAVGAIQDRADLPALVRQVEADLQQQASLASVSLVASCSPGVPDVAGDPETLRDLLANLLSNAIKYTPAGGEVRVNVSAAADAVEIRVSDTGIGIPAEEQPLVFDDFYRGSNARASGKDGTGLGLAIVKAIVEAHRGTVSLESEVQAGTQVIVRLPLGARVVAKRA